IVAGASEQPDETGDGLAASTHKFGQRGVHRGLVRLGELGVERRRGRKLRDQGGELFGFHGSRAHKCHGARIGWFTRRFASSSPTISSLTGSYRIGRPTRMAMFAR